MSEKRAPIMDDTMAAALLVIDVQQGLFERKVPIFKADELLDNIEDVVRKFQTAQMPVMFVQHSNQSSLLKGSREWELHPRLRPYVGEYRIDKLHGSAFVETGLQEDLQDLGIGVLVIMGLVTHGCVRATTLDALKHGNDVFLVQDGHSSFSSKAKKLIEKWNDALERKGAVLLKTADLELPLSRIK